MAREQRPVPQPFKTKTGAARVKMGGRDITLGPWGSREAQARYDAALAEWLGEGRRWTSRLPMSTWGDLARLYEEYAKGYYRKHGRQTASFTTVIRVCQLLFWSGLNETPLAEVGPRQISLWQEYLLNDPEERWARSTINNYTRVLFDMFRWAVSQERFDAERYTAIKTVRLLRKGRSMAAGMKVAREGRRVLPVPQGQLDAVLAEAVPSVKAMIELQLVTGMRPGELCAMRKRDLRPTRSPEVWAYVVAGTANKTDHHDIERVVYIGPKGMKILQPYLDRVQPDDPVFSPRRTAEEYLERRRASRKSKRWPSHDLAKRTKKRRRKGIGGRDDGEIYNVTAYRRAITRTCERICKDLPEEKRWTWHPHQLRHNAATYITEHESIEVAQLLLGHSTIATTMRYLKVAEDRATAAALKLG